MDFKHRCVLLIATWLLLIAIAVGQQQRSGNSSASHRRATNAQIDPTLEAFVGSWAQAFESDIKDSKGPCEGMTTHQRIRTRLVIEAINGEMVAKVTDYYYATTESGCHFVGTGTNTTEQTERYQGTLRNEGSIYKISFGDGACTGDCKGTDTMGWTSAIHLKYNGTTLEVPAKRSIMWLLEKE